MDLKVKKYTFSLPVETIDKMRKYAQENYIISVNAGVREAIEQYSIKLEKERLKNEIAQALKDPLFMKDIEECIHDFETSDDDMAERYIEW